MKQKFAEVSAALLKSKKEPLPELLEEEDALYRRRILRALVGDGRTGAHLMRTLKNNGYWGIAFRVYNLPRQEWTKWQLLKDYPARQLAATIDKMHSEQIEDHFFWSLPQ